MPINNYRREPLVSVIMNCHNSAKYLRESVESVLTQTYQNWEIIFWDNQSDDESARIFQSYIDERLHYHYAPKHTKLGEARNLAVAYATGDWIAFLDCDDVWLPDKLKRQIDIVCQDTAKHGIVYGQCLVMRTGMNVNSEWAKKQSKYTTNTVLKLLPEGNVFDKLLKFNFIPLLTAIVRKDAYEQVGGVSASFEQAEDYELFVKITKCYSVRAVQDVVALYRVHDSNRSIGAAETGHREALEIVSRYLPAYSAKRGFIYHQTAYSINMINTGCFRRGFTYFISHGDLKSFIEIVMRRISRTL